MFNYKGSYSENDHEEFVNMESGKEYEFVIASSEERQSKTGKQMLYIELQPTCAEFSGRTIRHYIVEGEYFDKNIGQLIASSGRNPDNDATFEAEHLLGWTVYGVIKHEKYDGKLYDRIHYFKPKHKQVNDEAEQETVKSEDCPF